MIPYSFDHLHRLSTPIGTFEHAEHTTPRTEHGFCTDDVARVLVVTSREPQPTERVLALGQRSYRFLVDGQAADGRMHNRRSERGRWLDVPSVEDCWGRSLWGFGTAARHGVDPKVRQSALASFEIGAAQRSPWLHSMAFAALGAAEVLAWHPANVSARALLADAAAIIGEPDADPAWPWPERRLRYANAALPEALMAAGTHLQRPELVTHGLRLLRWLLERETRQGHLSPTPAHGAGPDDRAPAYDQQPIEVAALADACHRAALVSGNLSWLDGVDLAVRWFEGHNDVGASMIDLRSGGGYDGLHPLGPNLNQGAESTLAMLSTLQLANAIERTIRQPARRQAVNRSRRSSRGTVAMRAPTSANP